LIDLTLLLPKTKIEKLVPELELDPLVLLPMLKNLLNKSKKNNLLMKCKLESLLLMKMMTSIIKNKSNSKCLTLLKEKKKCSRMNKSETYFKITKKATGPLTDNTTLLIIKLKNLK
jgi:predicted sugar kinase